MTFLNYQDKVKVMKVACQKGKEMYRNQHVRFFLFFFYVHGGTETRDNVTR